jgi:uncharacterized protein
MLTVEDVTQGRVLVERGRKADNFFTRLRGLMGVRDLPEGDGLLIVPANQVHTHFMSIPIDVVYLDREDRVMDFDEAMGPFRFGRLRRGARAVLELPAGAVAAHGVQRGDQLRVATA